MKDKSIVLKKHFILQTKIVQGENVQFTNLKKRHFKTFCTGCCTCLSLQWYFIDLLKLYFL